jgi:hypothetical protein
MSLATLRSAIRESSGPVTGIELAHRLGMAPGEVSAMLDALRAAGQLNIEQPPAQPDVECSSARACSLACPGPNECPLVVDFALTSLEIRKSA